jgi:hypothetical protein
MTEAWIAYWERKLQKIEELCALASPQHRKSFYSERVVPAKHILRTVRLKADVPICWGASDCVEIADQQCKAGKHTTCETHQDGCVLCQAG